MVGSTARDRRQLAELRDLAALEPRSSLALVAALSAGSHRHVRVLHAGPHGSTCTLVRREPGAWIGYPVLVDPSDAEALGAAVEGSAAIGVDGSPADVEPLLPFIPRAGETLRFRRIVVARDEVDWPPPDPAARQATRLDLPGLEALFEGYEISFGRSRRARRRYLVDAVDRLGAIVHEGAHGIDAALLSEGFTPGYLAWSHLRVDPGSRGRGLSWLLIARAAASCRAHGLGFMATVADDNPMTLPTHLGRLEDQVSANFSLPDRVPGERRVRRIAWRTRDALRRRRMTG